MNRSAELLWLGIWEDVCQFVDVVQRKREKVKTVELKGEGVQEEGTLRRRVKVAFVVIAVVSCPSSGIWNL